MNQDVIILGAGLSGLGCALDLPGARVFEAEERPGGMIRSCRMGRWFFDQGAHILHSKDPEWVSRLCRYAGDVHHIHRSKVANYWHGHWVRYPVQNHLHELPLDIRVRALTDFVRAQSGQAGQSPKNYEEWCRFQYGDALCDLFYAEYTNKYWRAPMADLATDWLAGRLLPSQVDCIVQGAFQEHEETQPAFAQFRYPRGGGVESLFAPLFQEASITCGARAVNLNVSRRQIDFADGHCESYRFLASSIPLPDLVAMTEQAPEDLRVAARSLRSLKLICVNMTIQKPALTPLHWFYIYDSDILPARLSLPGNLAGQDDSHETPLQAEVFRRPEEVVNEQEIRDKTLQSLSRLLNFDPGDVVQAETKMVPLSYVVSDHHRAEAAGAICRWYEERSVFPMGLYGAWKYVWSDQAFQAGRSVARRINDAA